MSSFSERYTLRVPLGESSLGSVWTALDRESNQQVCVLRLEEEAATETAKARFRDHAQRLSKIAHPNVVKALDHGDDEQGIPYLVVELLEGESLAARWASSPIRIDRFVDIAIGAAEGLGALHAAGFAHGDVEPGNVFLVGPKGQETPKLIGIALNRVYARVGDDGEERTSMATLHQLYAYAAPEQVKGTTVDSPQADLYSLAAVVYAGLTGKPPHVAPTVIALVESVTTKKPPTLAQIKRELGPFSATIERALSAEPAKRFPDAASFGRALKTCLVMGRALATQELPVGARSPIGQPVVVAAAAAKPLGIAMPKPGAALKAVPAPKSGETKLESDAAEAKAEARAEAKVPAESQTPAKVEPATAAKAEPTAAAKGDVAKPAKAEPTAASPEAKAQADDSNKTDVVKLKAGAKPLPRPMQPTIRGLSPAAKKPAEVAKKPEPLLTSDGESEGRSTEEIEIPASAEIVIPAAGAAAPPPPPPAASADIPERTSIEFEDYSSSEIAIPPEVAAPPPPPAAKAEKKAEGGEAPAAATTIATGGDAQSARASEPSDREAAPTNAPEASAADGGARAASSAAEARAEDAPAESAAEPAKTEAAKTDAAKPAPPPKPASKPQPEAAATDAPKPTSPTPSKGPKTEPIELDDASSVPIAIGSDDEPVRPARPAWMIPAALGAVALVAVVIGVLALGGGDEGAATDTPIAATEPSTATEPAGEAHAAPTAAETGTTEGETDTTEIATDTADTDTADTETETAETEAAETEAAETEAAETEAERVAVAPPAPPPATERAATAPATTRASATTGDRTGATARAGTTTRTGAATARTGATTTARAGTTTARTGTTARTPARTGGGRRPTVVSDPGF